jgi:phospholipid/cholesterol/gamma-HCH transport system substrate-binding protein
VKISKEVKVGLLALVAGVILYMGFNFLKGVDFFSPTKKYYIVYDQIDGLTVSNPVTLNGMTIGRVDNLKMITSQNNKIVVEILVDEHVVLGDSTSAFIANTDLLGGKSIDLKLGKNTKVYDNGDTLQGVMEKNITEMLREKAIPILTNLDSTVVHLNNIFGDELGTSIKKTLHNFELASEDLKLVMGQNRKNLHTITSNLSAMTSSLAETERELKPLIAKMSHFADSLNDLELKATVANANKAMENLNSITGKINSGEGSLGALVNDKAFVENLNHAVKSMDKLLIDLRNNPRHYFAPLGQKPKKGYVAPE